MKKTFKVKISESAQSDITEIWEYVSISHPKNAKHFLEQIERRILALKSLPLKNSLIPENLYLQTNYRHIPCKGYRIIYRISGDMVYVLRVIHGSKLLDMD